MSALSAIGVEDFAAMMRYAKYSDLPRWRKNVVWLYVSNRLHEWRWVVLSRILRFDGPAEQRLHPYRGNITGSRGDQRRRGPGEPPSNRTP
jgi:hypothetical protein